MEELIGQVTAEFAKRFGGKPVRVSQSPGRINILGEHTDYTGGLSLPAAIDSWTVCAWRPRRDGEIHIYSANIGGAVWKSSWVSLAGDIDAGWKRYVAGALLMFRESHTGADLPGFELAIAGNIPLGKGVSSSAAIELAVLNGIAGLAQVKSTGLELAKLAQQVEHRFLHVKSGLLDQFACQFSTSRSALLIDFASLETSPAPVAPAFGDYRWVLVDSKVKRELASSKYSERVEEFQSMTPALKRAGRASLRDVKSNELTGIFGAEPLNIQRRARHIVTENERTLQAVQCLRDGEVESLGRLMVETHISLARDYEVSHPNLDFLVEDGIARDGVRGGRMMGGGFGGCALFLVRASQVPAFSHELANAYEKFSGFKSTPWAVRFADGASSWPVE